MSNKIILNPVTGQLQFITDPENLQDIIQNDITPLHRMKETNDNSKTETTKVSASHKLRVVDEVLKAAGVGGAISLDGINDYVDFGDTPFDFNSDFSIEKWIKPHNVTANDQFFIWKSVAFGIGMGAITGIAGTQNKRFCFVCYDGTQWNAVKDVSDAIIDTFYHVRGEIDTTANQIRLFVNGVNVANAAFTGNPAPSNFRLFAGAYDSGGGVAAGFSNIDLDEIRAYNRILTSQESTDHYNGGSGQYGSPESGLIGLYHADEGSGQTVTDYSGNGNHGTMTGGSWTTGVVSVSAGLVETTVYESVDGTGTNEEGKKVYGHCNGETKIQGKEVPFCIQGTEKVRFNQKGIGVGTTDAKAGMHVNYDNATALGVILSHANDLSKGALIDVRSDGSMAFYAKTTGAVDGFTTAHIHLIIEGITDGNIILNNVPKFVAGNTTGAGSALLGANSPATITAAPYTWFTTKAADGTTVYLPAWA